MKAIVTGAFPEEGEADPNARRWQAGETIRGHLAKVAVEEGWAEEVRAQPNQAKPRRRNKAAPAGTATPG